LATLLRVSGVDQARLEFSYLAMRLVQFRVVLVDQRHQLPVLGKHVVVGNDNIRSGGGELVLGQA